MRYIDKQNVNENQLNLSKMKTIIETMMNRKVDIERAYIWLQYNDRHFNGVLINKHSKVSYKCFSEKYFLAAARELGIFLFLLCFKYFEPARTVKNCARWLVFGIGKLIFSFVPRVRERLNVKKSIAFRPHCPVTILCIITKSVVFLLDSNDINFNFLFLNEELGIVQYL